MLALQSRVLSRVFVNGIHVSLVRISCGYPQSTLEEFLWVLQHEGFFRCSRRGLWAGLLGDAVHVGASTLLWQCLPAERFGPFPRLLLSRAVGTLLAHPFRTLFVRLALRRHGGGGGLRAELAAARADGGGLCGLWAGAAPAVLHEALLTAALLLLHAALPAALSALAPSDPSSPPWSFFSFSSLSSSSSSPVPSQEMSGPGPLVVTVAAAAAVFALHPLWGAARRMQSGKFVWNDAEADAPLTRGAVAHAALAVAQLWVEFGLFRAAAMVTAFGITGVTRFREISPFFLSKNE